MATETEKRKQLGMRDCEWWQLGWSSEHVNVTSTQREANKRTVKSPGS